MYNDVDNGGQIGGVQVKEVKIMLKGVEKIAEFVNIMERLGVNADLGQGRIRIDARSMIGVMAMDTTGPITLSINESEDVVEKVLKKIDAYLVK